MFKNNNVFDNKKSSGALKYFIIAFSLFIFILSVVSAFLFMRSIDFDMNNLTGKTTTEPVNDTDNVEVNDALLSDLTGKSKILFICENNENKLDFICLIDTDFEQAYMNVSSFDDDDLVGKDKTFGQIYSDKSVDGIKDFLNDNLGLRIDKYILCNRTQLKDIFALFDDIQINIEKPVNYHSYEFNLELKAGEQVLSDDYLVKYLIVDADNRSQIMCDILNSILIPKYTENSQKLFTNFVNLCETDISVIDYSEKIDDLIIYSKSEDKFLVTVK